MSRIDGIEKELASRVDERVLRWFGQVVRMDEQSKTRRVLVPEALEGICGIGRGFNGWKV